MKPLLGRLALVVAGIVAIGATVLVAIGGLLRGGYALKGARHLQYLTERGNLTAEASIEEVRIWNQQTSRMIDGVIDCLLIISGIAVVSLLLNIFLVIRRKDTTDKNEIGEQAVGDNMP